MPIESRVEARLVRMVTEHGGKTVKIVDKKDWPDRILLFPNGKMLFCELKRPRQKPRPGQLRNHETLRKMGFDVWVFDGSDWTNVNSLLAAYASS